MAGYIKLYRDIQEHWTWQGKPFSKGQAWIDLLMAANHDDNKVVLGNEIILVERGCLITSEVKLAKRWGWSRHKVRDFLTLLENDSMIGKKTDTKRTYLNIVNYSVWQDSETAKGHQKDIKRTSKGQRRDTNKNDKNDKNDKNIEISKDISCQPPYQKIINLFHETCKPLPRIRSLTEGRRRAIKAWWKSGATLENYIELFTLVEQSDFLSGRSGKWNGCCFDWIIKPNNRQKILEGNYNNKEKSKKSAIEEWVKQDEQR